MHSRTPGKPQECSALCLPVEGHRTLDCRYGRQKLRGPSVTKGGAKLTVTFLAAQASPLGTIHLLLELWDARHTGCGGFPGLGSLSKPGPAPLTSLLLSSVLNGVLSPVG